MKTQGKPMYSKPSLETEDPGAVMEMPPTKMINVTVKIQSGKFN